MLVADQLKELWLSVEGGKLSAEEFHAKQERLLYEYRSVWSQALLLDGYKNLEESLLSELGRYLGCRDAAEIKNWHQRALSRAKAQWYEEVDPHVRESVERFYDQCEAELYSLLCWHALNDDLSPLAYVAALEFARQQGCASCLDFGAGVGSGGILFARHGLEVTLADISSRLLGFSEWRFRVRGLAAPCIDLKTDRLPARAFDLVTAMDVFEHLVDPVEAVERLWEALKPGGFLFGRFHAEPDDKHTTHIVKDFGPTLDRIQKLGLIEVWRDEWLWGHQVFQKKSLTP
jgi:SAM-dependent methyltransferase